MVVPLVQLKTVRPLTDQYTDLNLWDVGVIVSYKDEGSTPSISTINNYLPLVQPEHDLDGDFEKL